MLILGTIPSKAFYLLHSIIRKPGKTTCYIAISNSAFPCCSKPYVFEKVSNHVDRLPSISYLKKRRIWVIKYVCQYVKCRSVKIQTNCQHFFQYSLHFFYFRLRKCGLGQFKIQHFHETRWLFQERLEGVFYVSICSLSMLWKLGGVKSACKDHTNLPFHIHKSEVALL